MCKYCIHKVRNGGSRQVDRQVYMQVISLRHIKNQIALYIRILIHPIFENKALSLTKKNEERFKIISSSYFSTLKEYFERNLWGLLLLYGLNLHALQQFDGFCCLCCSDRKQNCFHFDFRFLSIDCLPTLLQDLDSILQQN